MKNDEETVLKMIAVNQVEGDGGDGDKRSNAVRR
jgi:hypothetical protein